MCMTVFPYTNDFIQCLAIIRSRYPLVCKGRSFGFVSTLKDRDDRYIQTSKLPTMHFQPGLFRLTIPKLEDTCARYLAALKPVAPSEEAFAKTKGLVEDFKRDGGIGKGEATSVCLIAIHVCACRIASEADSTRSEQQAHQLYFQAMV